MTATFDFRDKRVFVFGGTSGINLGIARCFAGAGAEVAVASRSQDKVDAAVAELEGLGSAATGYALDVRDAGAVETALAEHAAGDGSIDILVSGAAGNFPALAHDMSPNGFKSVVDIDLLGSFHVLRAAFQYLAKPGASVINISAPQAFVAMPMQSHVCAAKAGVDMLTRTLALEWGPYGIRVNSICPGAIRTPINTEAWETPEAYTALMQLVPYNRIGEVDDIGRAVVWLASDHSDYVTGANLYIDGGMTLYPGFATGG